MSIIVNATKRLEELRRAGVSMPWADGHATAAPGQDRDATADRMAPPEQGQPPLHIAEGKVAAAAPPRESRTVTLDLERLERTGVIVSPEGRSNIAEQFRHAKRPLLRNVRGGAGGAEKCQPLLMVTSALPGEGKTFCAINLAISMAAEIDTSVLLVDADVVRPDLLRRLGVEAPKGLIDLLSDPSLEPADVMLKTNIPTLSIMPSGLRDARSTEWLASEAMASLLADLASRYSDRVVIFDAPPLLVTTEAQVLASHMGQVVVVVEALKTPRHAIEQAFASVAQCPIVMSLLNKSTGPLQGGDGYGYGYGYY